MSVRTPPRLLDLAGMHLLRDDDLAFSALEQLPVELFPPLFTEAFNGRHTEILKAMVQAWPFVCLPLGDSLTCLMWGPYKQCWKPLMSYLSRRFAPGESDSDNLVKSWCLRGNTWGDENWVEKGWTRGV